MQALSEDRKKEIFEWLEWER